LKKWPCGILSYWSFIDCKVKKKLVDFKWRGFSFGEFKLGRLNEKCAMSTWNLETMPIFLLEGRGKSRKPEEKWKIGGQLGRPVSECCIGK
jgi:hypothetical protein